MKPLLLTHKDLLELKFWLTCDKNEERVKNYNYLDLFGVPKKAPAPWIFGEQTSVLEIGTGPMWGLLPYMAADRKVAIDPMINAYDALGILEDRVDIQYYSEEFEKWDVNDKFNAIVCANSLDHGEMGFHLMPKFSALLKSGGYLMIYVQLRRQEDLNLIHDHCLTIEQLNRNLSYTDLKEIKRNVLEIDQDPPFCPSVIGIWQKP